MFFLGGCAWTPERVSKFNDFDLCYEQWFTRTLLVTDKRRVEVVDQEITRRKLDCRIYARHIKERHRQYLSDMDFAVEVGKFGGKK
jgi:hypothetical protein